MLALPTLHAGRKQWYPTEQKGAWVVTEKGKCVLVHAVYGLHPGPLHTALPDERRFRP